MALDGQLHRWKTDDLGPADAGGPLSEKPGQTGCRRGSLAAGGGGAACGGLAPRVAAASAFMHALEAAAAAPPCEGWPFGDGRAGGDLEEVFEMISSRWPAPAAPAALLF